MNFLYRVPQNIDTYAKVDDHYNARRYITILYDWFSSTKLGRYLGWKDTVEDTFMKRMTTPELRRYYNICDFPEEDEFKRNAASGRVEYSKNSVDAYEAFWNYDGNYNLLSKFVRPKDSMFDLTLVESFLRKHQSGKPYEKILLYQPKRDIVRPDTALNLCEIDTNVKIKQGWTLFRLLGYKIYHIYDPRQNNKYVGSFYLKIKPGQPQTIPLGNSISLVQSPATHQLTHELVHAVQNCFTVFYKHPKELIEIPAMMVETKYSGCTQAYIDRNIALSLADIYADDPYTFDKVFNRESKFLPEVKVSNRFWHYIHYPRQYYTYTLGLLMRDLNIADVVRDPSICEKKINELLIESHVTTLIVDEMLSGRTKDNSSDSDKDVCDNKKED